MNHSINTCKKRYCLTCYYLGERDYTDEEERGTVTIKVGDCCKDKKVGDFLCKKCMDGEE